MNININTDIYSDVEERFSQFSNMMFQPNERPAYDRRGNEKKNKDGSVKIVSTPLFEDISQPATFNREDLTDTLYPGDAKWNFKKNKIDKGIRIPFGYFAGDKSIPLEVELGDNGDVHMMMAGGTGAGKSFSYYAIIQDLCDKYAPYDLRLWLGDFKKVTFNIFLPDSKGIALPHVDACVCTKDGNYVASFFEGYVKKMAEIQYLFKHGVKDMSFEKIKDWNEYWENQAAEQADSTLLSKRLPRHLMIIDELGACLSAVDADIKGRIFGALGTIGREGRSMGMHMILSSQDLTMLPAELVGNITARLCLRVQNKDLSTFMIGTDDSARITQKFGLAYAKAITNSYIKEKAERIAVPGYKTNMKEFVNKMYEKAKEIGFKAPEIATFDEEIPMPWSQLLSDVVEIDNQAQQANFDSTGMFIFGRLMEYKPEQRLPYNRMYGEIANTHIMSQFVDSDDLFNFFKLLKFNITRSGYKYMLNTQAGDSINTFLKVEEEDCNKEILHMEFRKFVSQVQALYAQKVSKKSKTPVWIVCLGWDRVVDFGISPDYDLNKELTVLLNNCAQFGMHFCFINTVTSGKVRADVISACTTKVSSLIDSDSSMALFEKTIATVPSGDLRNHYMVIKDGMEITRARMYTSEEDRGKEIKRGFVK